MNGTHNFTKTEARNGILHDMEVNTQQLNTLTESTWQC